MCVCVCVCVCMCRYIYMYNKERCEQNEEEILKYRRQRYRTIQKKNIYIHAYIYISKYRRERYRTIHKKDLNINVSTGTFTLYFD